jgi:hypothetical protein
MVIFGELERVKERGRVTERERDLERERKCFSSLSP